MSPKSFQKGGQLSDRPVPLPHRPRRSLWRARGQAQNAPLAETIRSPKFAHGHRPGSPSAAAKRRRFTPDRPLTTLDSPDITVKTCADGRESGPNAPARPWRTFPPRAIALTPSAHGSDHRRLYLLTPHRANESLFIDLSRLFTGADSTLSPENLHF